MNALGPPLHSPGLWAAREAKFLATIALALKKLRAIPELPESEVELNRPFYFCLLEASRELYPDDEVAPVAEGNNQPDPDDEARAKRELKRPDFQWVYLDRYEASARHSSKQFVVECKRLGNVADSRVQPIAVDPNVWRALSPVDTNVRASLAAASIPPVNRYSAGIPSSFGILQNRPAGIRR